MVNIKTLEVEAAKRTKKKYGYEYKFKTAEGFYYALLNLNDTIAKDLQHYYPAIHQQRRWIFRGQWDSAWGLIPSAFRKEWYKKFLIKPPFTFRSPILDPNSPMASKPQIVNLKNIKYNQVTEREDKLVYHILMECDVLEQFMEVANSLGIDCNHIPSIYRHIGKLRNYFKESNEDKENEIKKIKNWPYGDISPLMVLAQHHGLPTRLLDFTYNPLFAAFFAASNPFFEEYLKEKPETKPDINKNLCIWAIDESTANKDTWQKIPAQSNRSSNLFAQEGVLVLDPNANKKFIDKNARWQNLISAAENTFIKFTLPQSKYKELLRLLWEYNITPAKTKPNPDSVTQTLEYIQWLWVDK